MMIDTYIVKRLYKQKGLTQEEFARETAISYRKMSGILSKGIVKKEGDAHRMASVLGVTLDALLADRQSGPLVQTVDNESLLIDQSGNRNKNSINYKNSESTSSKIAELERELANLKNMTLERENELLKEIIKLQNEQK